MNLLSLFKGAAKPLADGLIAQVQAQRSTAIEALAAANVTAASVVEDRLLAVLQSDPHLGPVAKAINLKPIVDQAMPTLVAEFGNEEGVLFDLVVAKLKELESKALG